MTCVYLLRFRRNGALYIGSSTDLRRRLRDHAREKRPFDLVYYEAYRVEPDARRREHSLKYFGRAYGQLKGRIRDSLR